MGDDSSSGTESLSTHTLFNRDLIKQRYPAMDLGSLDASIGKKVEKEIRKHLNSCGFLDENNEGCVDLRLRH